MPTTLSFAVLLGILVLSIHTVLAPPPLPFGEDVTEAARTLLTFTRDAGAPPELPAFYYHSPDEDERHAFRAFQNPSSSSGTYQSRGKGVLSAMNFPRSSSSSSEQTRSDFAESAFNPSYAAIDPQASGSMHSVGEMMQEAQRKAWTQGPGASYSFSDLRLQPGSPQRAQGEASASGLAAAPPNYPAFRSIPPLEDQTFIPPWQFHYDPDREFDKIYMGWREMLRMHATRRMRFVGDPIPIKIDKQDQFYKKAQVHWSSVKAFLKFTSQDGHAYLLTSHRTKRWHWIPEGITGSVVAVWRHDPQAPSLSLVGVYPMTPQKYMQLWETNPQIQAFERKMGFEAFSFTENPTPWTRKSTPKATPASAPQDAL